MSTPNRPLTVFRPTVVIGLGGTGYGVLLKLKQRLVEIYGKVPPVIKLLSIDTTENEQNRESTAQGVAVSLDPSELYQISITNPSNIVRNRNIQEWWPPQVNANLGIERGAGQVRARGRLGLFAKSADIFGLIHHAIANVRDLRNSRQSFQDELLVSNTGGVEVFIVGSIAGGTGSGTFLDVAFMARNGDPQISITGILALPRVFANKPITEMVKSNAYGALKEIEHFWQPQTTEIDYGLRQLTIERSPFDLLFLIDGINESGRMIGEPKDLQNLIADGLYVQVASQIGVDNNNSNDNIKGMLSERKVCKNRFWVNYCSFGVASLTLPTKDVQRLQWQDSCNLIEQHLLGQSQQSIDSEDEIESLMQSFGLQDRTVIDALSEKETGGQLSFPFSMAGFAYTSGADRRIKEKLTQHMSSMETSVVSRIRVNYTTLSKRIIQSVENWWQENVNRENGLDYCQKALEILTLRLEESQRSYQSKARDFERQQKGVRLEDREAKIREAASAILSKENKVTAACQEYARLVTQMSQYYLNYKRYDKAAELMGEVLSLINKFLARQTEVKSALNQLVRNFQQKVATSSASVDNPNLFVHTLQRFNIADVKPQIVYEDFLIWQKEQNCRVSDWGSLTVGELQEKITAFIAERYGVLTDLSVEEALRQSTPDQAGEDLKQLWDLACPLWRYDEAKIPIEDAGTIHETCYYGTADANTSILNDPIIQQQLPSRGNKPSIVSTGDSTRITLFRVRIGVPLFALQGIEEMKQHYDDPGRAFKHLHKDWASFSDLIPTDDDDDAMECFALALALGIIQKRGKSFQTSARLTGSRVVRDIKLADDRVGAYNEFKHRKNKELLELVKAQVYDRLAQMDKDGGQDKVCQFLNDYANDLSAKLEEQLQKRVKIDSTLQQQVEAEIHAIENHLDHLDTL